jgi:hypothetical protein
MVREGDAVKRIFPFYQGPKGGGVRLFRKFYRKEHNTKTIIVILSVIIAFSATGLAAGPSIGKDTSDIVFDKNESSRTFKVWNRGTATLTYNAVVISGAKYFKVSPSSGQSIGKATAVTHKVTVDFTAIPLNTTVTGRIVISSTTAVNSPQYIDLKVDNSVDRHIQFIKIEKGIDYIPGVSDAKATVGNCDGLGMTGDFDCDGYADFLDFVTLSQQWKQKGSEIRADISPTYKDGAVNLKDLSAFCKNWLKGGRIGETYDFTLSVKTDNTVSSVQFTTPDGDTYKIPDSNKNNPRHIESTLTKLSNVYYWKHQEWFYEANGLENYVEGKYIVKFTHTDHNSNEVIVGFGIPNKPGSISQPTQQPEMIYPQYTDSNVSPLQCTWAKCTDSNVNAIRLGLSNPKDSNLAEEEYTESALRSDTLKLEPGKWFAQLSFGRWYQPQDDNNIPLEVGKTNRSHLAFDISKGFGTFGELKNHQLQVKDCQGKMVTFALTGDGEGYVEGDPNVQGDCSFAKIVLSGTTEKSVLTITPQKGAKTTIGSIEADGPVKMINAANVNMTGNINVDGAVSGIVLNDISGNSKITIGSPSSTLPKTTSLFKFGRINKLAMTSGTPIAILKATEWKTGSLNAPSISSLAIDGNIAGGIAGNFGANVNLSGQGVSLKKAKIAGLIGASTWNIAGSCGTITVAGELGDAAWNIAGNCGKIQIAASSAGFDANITGSVGTLRATGNNAMATGATLSGTWRTTSVKTIKATDISECNLTASQETADKTTAIGKITAGRLMDSDITAAKGFIKALTIKGVVLEPYGIINSNVRANHIGSAYLAFPKYSNNSETFGLKASTVDRVTVKDPTRTWTRKNLQVGAEIIATEDFQIELQ